MMDAEVEGNISTSSSMEVIVDLVHMGVFGINNNTSSTTKLWSGKNLFSQVVCAQQICERGSREKIMGETRKERER